MTKTEFLSLPAYIIKPIMDKAYWLCEKGYASGDPIDAAIRIYKTQQQVTNNEQCDQQCDHQSRCEIPTERRNTSDYSDFGLWN